MFILDNQKISLQADLVDILLTFKDPKKLEFFYKKWMFFLKNLNGIDNTPPLQLESIEKKADSAQLVLKGKEKGDVRDLLLFIKQETLLTEDEYQNALQSFELEFNRTLATFSEIATQKRESPEAKAIRNTVRQDTLEESKLNIFAHSNLNPGPRLT